MTTFEPLPDGGSGRPQPWRGIWPTPMTINRTSRKAQKGRPTSGPQRGGASYGLEDVVMALEAGQPDPRLTLWPEDSPASRSAQPGAVSPRTIPAGSGPRWPVSFADYDPATRSWRTFQGSLLAEWETYSGTWPRAGMTRNGIAYQRQPSVPLTAATGSGLLPIPDTGLNPNGHGRRGGRPGNGHQSGLWPTPTTLDHVAKRTTHAGGNLTLQGAVGGVSPVDSARHWPTPRSQNGEPRNHKVWRRPDGEPQNLENAIAAADPSAIGGLLNPAWVEALMGYPIGWTELDD